MAPLFEPWCANVQGFKNGDGALISARIVKTKSRPESQDGSCNSFGLE
jgi:hypothetical protein